MNKLYIEDEVYDARTEETLLAVANRENHYLGEICFRGNCAGCLVEISSAEHSKLYPAESKEMLILRVLKKSPENFRLACQAKIKELPLTIKKPLV